MFDVYPPSQDRAEQAPLVLRNQIFDPKMALDGDYHVTYATSDGRVAQKIVTPAEVDGTPLDMMGLVRGSQVMTEDGPKLVEELEVGDRIETKDDGLQPLRWIARRRIGQAELAGNPALRPVRLRADALGDGIPEREVAVAPGLRTLVSGWRCQVLFGEDEVLAPAIGLRNDHAVVTEYGAEGVEYFHLMFDAHQVIFAEGLEVESFHPGYIPPTTLDPRVRQQLAACFPHLEAQELRFGSVARPRLKPHEAQVLLETANATV